MPATKGHKTKAGTRKPRKARASAPIYVIVHEGGIVGRTWGSKRAAENFNHRSSVKGTVRKVK